MYDYSCAAVVHVAEETRRMGRAALEGGLGRGSYVVGAQWDEGNMVHAMRRFGGTTVGWRFGDG